MDWIIVLDYVVDGLKCIKVDYGVVGIGVLGLVYCIVEELYLLVKLMCGLGSENIDYCICYVDFGNVVLVGKV